MVFSSLEFIFRFLPVFLIVYYLVPEYWKNAVLLLGSIVFYAFGEPVYVLLIMASVAVNYYISSAIGKNRRRRVRASLLGVDIIFNIGLLAVFKYLDFVIENINLIGGLKIKQPHLALPLGISFFTFQILSYVIDVYRRKIPYDRSIVDLGTYILMFPQLIAGPIVTYDRVALDLKSRQRSLSDLEEGLVPFITGLAMKVLLANNMGTIWDNVGTAGYENISTAFAWIGALAYTMQIYFDFAGYSMMAIGLGRMLGFSLPENFNFPYSAVSVKDFWNRWHMTLTAWFREYIYIPLGGNRKGPVRNYVNLLIVWFITGLWHGAAWNFVFWGLYYFCFIAAERLFLGRLLKKIPKVFGWLYTMLVVMIGWVLFAVSGVGEFQVYITRMFGFHAGTDYLDHLRSVILVLAAGAFFAAPLWGKIYMKIRGTLIGKILFAVLFWISVSALVDAAYNPFLYFRF